MVLCEVVNFSRILRRQRDHIEQKLEDDNKKYGEREGEIIQLIFVSLAN